MALPITVTSGGFTYVNGTTFDNRVSDDRFRRGGIEAAALMMIGSGALTWTGYNI